MATDGRRAQSRLLVVCLAVALLAGRGTSDSGFASQSLPQTPSAEVPLQALLTRASNFTVRFADEFRGVVARERYTQVTRPGMRERPREPRLDSFVQRRELLSTLLLVHDACGPWQLHRDVIEVDGRQLSDRLGRLHWLFVSTADDVGARLRRVTEEGARFNLGTVERTINIPTFPLIVLHPTTSHRFRFKDGGAGAVDDVPVRRIVFDEVERPTLVRTYKDRDVKLRGVITLEEETGAYVHAVLEPEVPNLTSHVEVSFGHVDGLPLRVPIRMWEWYFVRDLRDRSDGALLSGGGGFIEGVADYDEFRRFGVEVEDEVISMPGSGGQSAVSTPAGWEMVWADEFDVDGLPDPSKWSYDVGGHGWGNEELQFYTDGRRENARVEGGRLVVEARREHWQGKSYTSARLVSKDKGDWTYGRIEVRAKLPAGRGSWPAIWMLPTIDAPMRWPDDGEIDIMEHVGFDEGVVHGSVHTRRYHHSIGTQKTGRIDVLDATSAFHAYVIEWSPVRIIWFVDGREYFRFDKEAGGTEVWPFDRPFHLVLNVAVGGSWGGDKGVDEVSLPYRMEIEHVRVSRRDTAAGEP